MEKKYQVFISSTYEDLKSVRNKAIHTVLSMNQFPVGMEHFSATNEEQWQIIKETIDVSDYYVLIIGRKYGSTVLDGTDVGISYTEKEFNYALEKGIPIFAFIMDDKAKVDGSGIESDPQKLIRLNAFIERVKTDRIVSFWKNEDDLCAKLSQTLYKAMTRGSRPGWVRTTDFNIEESHARILELVERVHVLEKLNADLKIENNRKPSLRVEAKADNSLKNINLSIKDNEIHFRVTSVYMEDALNGIDYKDSAGNTVHCSPDDVKKFRYLYKNGFCIGFFIHNDGNAKASGVRVHLQFPNELLVISLAEIEEFRAKDMITFSKDAYENWDSRFLEPQNTEVKSEVENPFISLDELCMNDELATILDPSYSDEVVSIFPGEVIFDKEEVRHFDYDTADGIYILPTKAGVFEIKVSILCNEMAKPELRSIKVIVK